MLLAEIIVNSFFLALTIIFIILLGYGIYSFHVGAPFVPASRRTIQSMLELSQLKKGEMMLDLGSGDGRIVLAAAQTGAYCLGIEINPILCYLARLMSFLKRVKNVQFKRMNFWNYNLEGVDAMFLYFIPGKMLRLEEKIKSEMKPGSRIISYGFSFPDWQYNAKDGKIYLYVL